MSDTSSSDFIKCTICHESELAHGDKQHLFTPEGTRVDTSQFARKRPGRDVKGDDATSERGMTYAYTQTPFDPVLRQALVSKGIITVEDLEQAQREIGVLTNQVTGGRDARTRSG